MSKLHKNLLYNFIGQFYLSILAVIIAPIYVKYLGLESYGLIGFFTVIQSWMQLFDMGFSATLNRQSAQYYHGALSGYEFRSYFKSVQVLFSAIGLLLLIVSFFIGYFYSGSWIKAEHLSQFEIKVSTILIFMISVCRWQQGFYRGMINGFEQQEWINKFNMISATFKYIFVLGVLHFIRSSICDFFYYQSIIVVIEFAVLYGYVHNLLPKTKEKILFKLKYIQKNISFSLSVAFTSTIWVLVTQLDKLILSKYLLMQDYACYTLAVAVASGINMVTSPIAATILPRFSGLIAKNDTVEFIELYRKVTRLIVVLVAPITILFVFQGDKILFAWTNNLMIASQSNNILRVYALGNAVLAILSMAYYLQFAHGKLRLHVWGNLFSIFIMIPMLIYFTLNYGAVGASYVWLFSNLFYLIFWIPIVHKIYLKYSHFSWLWKDVLQVIVGSSFLSWLLMKYIMTSSDRIFIAMQSIIVVIISIFICGLIYFSELRKELLNRKLSFFQKDLENG